MPAPARVLVTRPQEDAQRWVAQLQSQGVQAEALPLLDIRPLMNAPALAACRQGLGRYAALMFVSGNAVTHLLGAGVQPWPAELRCLAPGPGTARALREAGVPADLIDSPSEQAAQFDSEALWEAVGERAWRGRRVLIVRGQGEGEGGSPGRDWLARQWEAAGAEVEFLPVYERCAPDFTPAQQARMAAAQADGSVWLFSSSEAVRHLPAGLRWDRALAVATHPRIAEAARQAGFARVQASRPTLADVVASIKSLNP